MITGRDISSYRNRYGTISQNVLAACNFDLEFIYVLSGWEGSAHDSKVLNDALSRRNGLKVPQVLFYFFLFLIIVIFLWSLYCHLLIYLFI